MNYNVHTKTDSITRNQMNGPLISMQYNIAVISFYERRLCFQLTASTCPDNPFSDAICSIIPLKNLEV